MLYLICLFLNGLYFYKTRFHITKYDVIDFIKYYIIKSMTILNIPITWMISKVFSRKYVLMKTGIELFYFWRLRTIKKLGTGFWQKNHVLQWRS